MEISKQSQNAGDNSTQMQAGTINNYYTTVTGIDEARARMICQEEYAIARQNWTSEATAIADNRVHQLEDKLMPKMIAYDNTLKIFADPDFQFTLRQAQISAASSERESDYEMLSELLLHRVEQGDNRERRLGIRKAIEVVNQITDEALIGLTMVYVISKFSPVSLDVKIGMSVLDNLYGKILDGNKLPVGENWMEHLDLLSAVRLGTKGINTFKKLEEYMPSLLSDYLVSGLEDNSEKLTEIKHDFMQCGIPQNCIVPYPLKQNYVYLNVTSKLENITITKELGNGITLKMKLNEQQKETMSKAISILKKDESNNISLKNKLMEIWDTYPNLKLVKEWWNELPCHFIITPVGVALANAYAHGKDSSVPCLY
jgi:hypothetical protein